MSSHAPAESLVDLPWERTLGARPLGDGRCEFRVWAPRADPPLTLRVAGRDYQLDPVGFGVYEGIVSASPGDDYSYLFDDRELPDPCSRWQPEGLRGPSRVFDARGLPGARDGFSTPGLDELIVYELHIGTFTEEGTFAAAGEHLAELADRGITAIEVMPIAEFPGPRGWGYDGVYISAAQSSYGGPQDFAELVSAAHRHGLAVILDVVYNHVGASGDQALEAFGPYFTDKYSTPWGNAINYDDADCDPVREWACQSAEGWVRDFGVDGLRLDAIHAIFDASAEHIVAEIARRVHGIRPGALVIAESGMNDPKVMRPREQGGMDCDAAWADDFHHALRTLITEDRDGYYADFGRVAQFAKALHRPHVDDGGFSPFRRKRFGAPADDVPVERFVVFSQDHDQVGNRAYGDRLPAAARPVAAFWTLLSPFVPMLFMGEEYGELAPFQYFTAHIDPDIAEATRTGRRAEFASFADFGGEIPDPEDLATFSRSKLTRHADPGLDRLYRQLITTRRTLAPGEFSDIDFDEDAGWVRARRGDHTLVGNFATGSTRVPCNSREVVLRAGGDAHLEGGSITLAGMSAALMR
jgi:maltooligosyltrehalose trehalohydrolase